MATHGNISEFDATGFHIQNDSQRFIANGISEDAAEKKGQSYLVYVEHLHIS